MTAIKRDQELIITDLAVVEDACRTRWDNVAACGATPGNQGKWTFGHLMAALAGETSITTTRARQFAANWLTSWLTATNVGQDPTPVAARPKIWDNILKPWLALSHCTSIPADTVTDGNARANALMMCAASNTLDLAVAPFRLSAIVNRIDLDGRDYNGNGAPGELRFVFGAYDIKNTPPTLNSINAAAIFEYHFPSLDVSGTRSFQWALSLHQLSSFAAFDASYMTQLQGITDRVVEPHVWPARPNGSAISHVRTSENIYDTHLNDNLKVWEFRQFSLSTCKDINLTGFSCLVQEPVSQTPPNSDNDANKMPGAPGFSGWLTNTFLASPANQAAAILGTHVIPAQHLGGSSISPSGGSAVVWNTAIDINSPDELAVLADPSNPLRSMQIRHGFAFSTCNGCHYFETQVQSQLFHITPRNPGITAGLSDFLKLTMTLSDYDHVKDPNPESNNDLGYTLYFDYNEIWRRACEDRRIMSGSSVIWSTPTGHH
jgi:hypothetical protein